MTIPGPDQTIHLMTFLDVLRVKWDMHRKEGRNVSELQLFTTNALRELYRKENADLIRLRDGIVTRVQLVAEIRWRIFWARSRLFLLLIAAGASIIAAVK